MKADRINRILLAILLSTIGLAGIVNAAEGELLATYAIDTEVRGSKSLIRGSKPMEFGKPLTYEFGEYQISLLFNAKGIDEFTLLASLNSIIPSTKTVVYTITSETYTGQLSKPGNRSEAIYTLSESEIEIGIAINVSAF